MDFFQKLFGVHEPTLMVIESDRWLTIPQSAEVDRAIERRARKERWSDHREKPGHEFHSIASIRGGGTSGYLEIQSLGYVLCSLSHEDSASALEQMRADNGLRATSVRCRAFLDEDERWLVSLNL
ncbi:hypothetical protein G7Y41_01020 [Schaalia sp. ZJ405]|uniref:hypothetical protein n=1 Tax=Schaalia sp. ZJ405 TaxID=2709403 RepID=UPI0013EA09E8|nr:hypothetical protein [Schaalia sp. ZJ405]QPK81481.1 hypothetical protein G7Y41_01020 [Schaalia sp. ZJ405]